MWVAKYELKVQLGQVFVMTHGKVIHVGEQEGRLFMWALMDDEDPSYRRVFHVIGTGPAFSVPPHSEYLGTVQMPGGLVWHVFEDVRS